MEMLLSFRSSPELLRGVALSRILARCSQTFDGSHGSESTYRLSEQVDSIQFFISHNWAVPRIKKFIVLACYFNFDIAMLACFIVSLVLSILQVLGALPSTSTRNLVPYKTGFFCVCSLLPTFFAVNFFVRDLLALFRLRGPSVFLDKICIHQVDEELMKAGIQKLGAFVRHSNCVLVLYTDLYLRKLWTVFEIAAFLAVHSKEQITVLPVDEWTFYCGCLFLCYPMTVASKAFEAGTGFSYTFYITTGVGAAAYGWVVRKWSQGKRATQVRLESFRVQDCVCAVESDRPLVYGNIKVLMLACGVLPESASEEDSLEAFNVQVRTNLLEVMQPFLGLRFAFRRRQYLFAGIAILGGAALDTLAPLSCGREPREVFAAFLVFVFWCLVGWPMLIMFAEICFQLRPALRGGREIAHAILAVIFLGALAFAVDMALKKLGRMAGQCDICLAGLISVSAVGLPVELAVMQMAFRSRKVTLGTSETQTIMGEHSHQSLAAELYAGDCPERIDELGHENDMLESELSKACV